MPPDAVSKPTIKRDLRLPKGWLFRRIHPAIVEDAVKR
jgi:hypothetical protein